MAKPSRASLQQRDERHAVARDAAIGRRLARAFRTDTGKALADIEERRVGPICCLPDVRMEDAVTTLEDAHESQQAHITGPRERHAAMTETCQDLVVACQGRNEGVEQLTPQLVAELKVAE
jgi:hypothetical protein